MSKTIKESYGALNSLNSLTMLKEDPCECPGGCDCDECCCGQKHSQMPQIDEDKKSERLAKIARAAAAREKDQAKEKEKATAKHNKASAKSRAGIKYRGNKDQFGRVREDAEQVDEESQRDRAVKRHEIFIAKRTLKMDDAKLEKLTGHMTKDQAKKVLAKYNEKVNEDVEQVDEAKSKSRIEMDKLMKKYGDMPVSKIPKKDYERIMQLRVSLREPSSSIRRHTSRDTIGRMGSFWAREKAESVELEIDEAKRHGFTPDIIKKMKEVLVRTAEGDLDVAMKINATLPKDAQKVLTKVKNKRELAKKLDEAAPKASAKMMANTQSQKKLRARIEKNKKIDKEIESRKQLRNRIIKKKTNEDIEISEMDPKLHVSEKDGKFNVANIKGKIVKTFDNEKDAVDYAKANHDDLMKESMIGRTKPSRELNVQKDEKPHLAGVKSLKLQKRAASKAERKKGKQDIKKGK